MHSYNSVVMDTASTLLSRQPLSAYHHMLSPATASSCFVSSDSLTPLAERKPTSLHTWGYASAATPDAASGGVAMGGTNLTNLGGPLGHVNASGFSSPPIGLTNNSNPGSSCLGSNSAGAAAGNNSMNNSKASPSPLYHSAAFAAAADFLSAGGVGTSSSQLGGGVGVMPGHHLHPQLPHPHFSAAAAAAAAVAASRQIDHHRLVAPPPPLGPPHHQQNFSSLYGGGHSGAVTSLAGGDLYNPMGVGTSPANGLKAAAAAAGNMFADLAPSHHFGFGSHFDTVEALNLAASTYGLSADAGMQYNSGKYCNCLESYR